MSDIRYFDYPVLSSCNVTVKRQHETTDLQLARDAYSAATNESHDLTQYMKYSLKLSRLSHSACLTSVSLDIHIYGFGLILILSIKQNPLQATGTYANQVSPYFGILMIGLFTANLLEIEMSYIDFSVLRINLCRGQQSLYVD